MINTFARYSLLNPEGNGYADSAESVLLELTSDDVVAAGEAVREATVDQWRTRLNFIGAVVRWFFRGGK